MATDAFISYAHADDARRERLHKHLAMLRREGLIREWSDHEILAGDSIDDKISGALDRAGLFIALLSPDYLASNYCYDQEFQRATELNQQGRLRIVGVVVEPCDWQNSPFGKLLVLPKDGKAVPEWTNDNLAYLNVVKELRRILERAGSSAPPQKPNSENSPSSIRKVKVKKDFDSIQRSAFADEAYETILRYFAQACQELPDASEHLRASFEEMSKTAFTCTIVNRAKTRGGEAHITVRRNKNSKMSLGDISFVNAHYADDGSSNGWLRVEANDYELYLRGSIGRFGLADDQNLTPDKAAETLWNQFMAQAGIEFD